MERNIRTNGLVNAAALLAAALAVYAASVSVESLAGRVSAIFLTAGFIVALASRFQMRLEENEQQEKRDLEELSRKSAESAIFTSSAAELHPAQRAREQFEKYLAPAFAVVLLTIQIGGAWGMWRWLDRREYVAMKQPVVGMAIMGLVALVLFLLGKYSANIARFEKERLLRPGAGYLLLGAYLSAAAAVGMGASAAAYPRIDFYLARIMVVMLALAGVENLVSLVFEIYRPRVKDQQIRLLYESRLIGLASQPEGLFTTAAQALDYQFGFKVSETWVYLFFKQYFGLFVLAQLVLLVLSTSVVVIDPGEQAIIERFGRPLAEGKLLNPGLHFKWLWPVEKVYRYQTEHIQTIIVGHGKEEEDEDHGHQKKAELMSEQHASEEFNMLVASQESGGVETSQEADAIKAVPVNFLAVHVPVQYQVTNLQSWMTAYADAAMVLERLAYREVSRFLVSVDMNDIMTTKRQQAADEIHRRIQTGVNELNLGARIVYVGLQNIHPPVDVAPAYQGVVSAMQQKESKILDAEAYAMRTVPLAKAEATKRQHEAEMYQVRKTAESQAQADQFEKRMAAYQAAPEVFTMRAYLDALSRGSAEARKIIIAATNTQDVILLNLEDKVRLGLDDVPMPETKVPAKTK